MCDFFGDGLEMKTGRAKRGVVARTERRLQLDLRDLELDEPSFKKRVRRISVFIQLWCFVFVLELQARAGALIAPAPAWFAF